jgi:hypothetical protein
MATNQHEEGVDEPLAGDFLVGAKAIREYLISLGVPDPDVYYGKRSGNLPIGNSGGDRSQLIASKQTLAKHFQKKARGSTAA